MRRRSRAPLKRPATSWRAEVNTPQKIAGFTLGLVVIFAAALGIGSVFGPAGGDVRGEHPQVAETDGGQNAVAAELPAGLSSSEDGYTLDLAETRLDAGRQVPLRFRITDASGAALTQYVENHEKQLHLIAVRRDMSGYQHVHPTLDRTGTWSVPIDLSAGDYRVFADFVPAGGEALKLGADLRVAGRYDPRPLPPPATTTTVGPYTVTLSGNPETNDPSTLTFSVSRGGKPITDLQPYLGAYGHLVALRASDLAYLHVHPKGEPGDGATPAGPEIAFGTTIPTSGDYRLFLDFKHENVVRTAEFTLAVDVEATSPQSTEPPAESGHGDGH
jgi:hypothetical protein